jgi:hypothetical protein
MQNLKLQSHESRFPMPLRGIIEGTGVITGKTDFRKIFFF